MPMPFEPPPKRVPTLEELRFAENPERCPSCHDPLEFDFARGDFPTACGPCLFDIHSADEELRNGFDD